MNREAVKKTMSYADLSYANFSFANLINADLSFANLKNAYLRNTNLKNANLKNANFSFANLINADLCYADLTDADLTNANLKHAKMSNTIMPKGWYCFSDDYEIHMCKEYIEIGCKKHTKEEWENFSDDEIDKMDKGALNWWNIHKDFIFNIHNKILKGEI